MTAVDYIYERLSTLYLFKDALLAQRALEEAKQIEKEQIITASSIGILWGEDEKHLQASVKFGEEYYDRTFISTPQSENPSATETGQS